MPTTGGSGQLRYDKNGNRLVPGPNGKLIPAPKAPPAVKRPTPQAKTPAAPAPVVNRPMASAAASPVLWSAANTNQTGNMSQAANIVPSPTIQRDKVLYSGGSGGSGVGPGGSGTYTAASTTGGVGTGVPGASTDLDKSLTGFAASFDPTLLNYVYAQPELILQQLMKNQGLNPSGANSGLYTATTPYVDALMSILPLAFGGGGQPDASSPINWVASQLQQGMKPGGEGIDFTQVLNALRSQTRDPNSAAGQYFTAPGMDPIDQFNKAKEAILGSASVSLAPQFQAAMKNAMNSAFNNYMGQFTTGGVKNDQNFLPWFLNSQNGYIRGY